MRFFLIDDDPLMLKLQETILAKAGHDVDSESDSESAIDSIIKSRPDCIVTDLMMPGLDGYQIITLVRKEPLLADTIIIVLSAKAFMQDKRQAPEFGANGFIRKPLDPSTYLEEINEILDAA